MKFETKKYQHSNEQIRFKNKIKDKKKALTFKPSI